MQDILNNSPYGSQYVLGDQRYNPTQSNVLGQSLSPTPTDSGLPAVDPVHDTRSPQDIKQQAYQANLDTLNAHDTDGKTVNPQTGYIYNVPSMDRRSQLTTGILAFGISMLSGGNDGENLMASGQAVNAQLAMKKRADLIPGLIQKGYADVDIQKYLETGDTKDLLVNKGKVNIVGDRAVNDLTGETKDLGMTPQQQADLQITQSKIAEDVRHNRASEGYEGARLGLEQQRINIERSRVGEGQQLKQDKQEAIKEANNSQIQAVATNAQRATQSGIDILNNPNIDDYSGASLTDRVKRKGSEYFGENVGKGMHDQNEKYNHQLTTLGNATLYTEAGNKRIFAKEMENSGKQFMPIDDYDSAEQKRLKIENNNEVISMYQQWAINSAAGKHLPNANQVQYGQTFAAPVPAMKQPGAATPAGGKDFSKLW